MRQLRALENMLDLVTAVGNPSIGIMFILTMRSLLFRVLNWIRSSSAILEIKSFLHQIPNRLIVKSRSYVAMWSMFIQIFPQSMGKYRIEVIQYKSLLSSFR